MGDGSTLRDGEGATFEMCIDVNEGIHDLADDLSDIAVGAKPAMRGVIRDGLKVGTALAKEYAKASAGPHGKAYYKRISSEMTGALEGEFGPSGTPKSEFVGVGFRHGVNTDLPRAADVVGPSFLRSVDDAIGDLFKRNGF